ncbi:hypothetical protein IGI04_003844 [Brassica rapa subsp. trilocularis]|uniref:Acidic protein n=1 Tax=Brassica rapa subsp. trilocularis TaxID=1813537 RepID=A0ABQ7NZK2_BRACM|nr:hypothetical protein IGI04_003844 [Brassica rapa subsp. trilocularis]
MESKTVILSVLIVMSLIMAQTQVDAKSCCPSKASRQAFNTCRIIGTPAFACEATTGCKIVWSSCPEGYNNHDILENSTDTINEYCNLGCVFSACGALTTLQNSDPNALVNGAVEQCTKACSTLCTKGSMIAVEAT